MTEWPPNTRGETVQVEMTRDQVRRLREELRVQSFKFVEDVPNLDRVKGKSDYLKGSEWYRDSSDNQIIINKVEGQKRYDVQYDHMLIPLVEDILRNP